MKKKKPPVVLVSMLVVLVGASVILFPKAQNPNEPPEAPTDVKPIGESRPTPSKSEIGQKLASTGRMKPGMPADAMEGGPNATGANSTTATIFLPKTMGVKQTPNDSSISAQWYRPDARSGKTPK